jgi:hypothetical protein
MQDGNREGITRLLNWAAALALGALLIWAADLPRHSCQEWAADRGLGSEATTLTCETGIDAQGEMTEVEYQRQQDEALELAYEIINENGGL